MQPLEHILFPRLVRKLQTINDKGLSFAHYTSADVALSILRHKQIWLRNASVMNDFSEVQHGEKCLAAALKHPQYGSRFKEAVSAVHPDAWRFLNERMALNARERLQNTYLTCLSIHGGDRGAPSEASLGRLSMWRAYGGATNVALVLRNYPIVRPIANVPVYASPVLYAEEDKFIARFVEVLQNIEGNINRLRPVAGAFVELLLAALDSAVLSTKHPGFAEEQEWRILYNDAGVHKLPCQVFSVGGVPQKVHLLDLKDSVDGSVIGMDLNSLLDHILIGPTQFPETVKSAMIQALRDGGYADPERRVRVSTIPLRR